MIYQRDIKRAMGGLLEWYIRSMHEMMFIMALWSRTDTCTILYTNRVWLV